MNQKGGGAIIYDHNKIKSYDHDEFFFLELLFHRDTVIEKIYNNSDFKNEISMVVTLPQKTVNKYKMEAMNEPFNLRKVTKMLVEFELTTSEDNTFTYTVNRVKKRAPGHSTFIKKVLMQENVNRKASLYGKILSPGILYSAHLKDYNEIFELLQFIKSNDKSSKAVFRDLAAERLHRTKLGIIAYELGEGYELLTPDRMKSVRKAIAFDANKKLYDLYRIGFEHNDEIPNKILFNKKNRNVLFIGFEKAREMINNGTLKDYIAYAKKSKLMKYIDFVIPVNDKKLEHNHLIRHINLKNKILINPDMIKGSYADIERKLINRGKFNKEATLSSVYSEPQKPGSALATSYDITPTRSASAVLKATPATRSKSATKSASKSAGKTRKNKCKGVSLSNCDTLEGCKSVRGPKRSYCRRVAKTAKKKKGRCVGLSESRCDNVSGCKMARGKMRSFCRKTRKAKK
jgi:hypothetical protein